MQEKRIDWQFFEELNMKLSYEQAIALLDWYIPNSDILWCVEGCEAVENSK